MQPFKIPSNRVKGGCVWHASSQALGDTYQSRLDNIEPNSCRIIGKTGVRNDDYLTRIARLVRENGKEDKELCSILVTSIDNFGRGIIQQEKGEVFADLLQALSILKEVYGSCEWEGLRFNIEVATAHISRELYGRLGSPCGPVISILISVDQAKYTPSKERSLVFAYDILPLSKTPCAVAVVLHNQESGKKYVIPPSKKLGDRGFETGSETAGSDRVVLPKGLPRGKYRVYYQVTEDDRVVGVGHYFETEL